MSPDHSYPLGVKTVNMLSEVVARAIDDSPRPLGLDIESLPSGVLFKRVWA